MALGQLNHRGHVAVGISAVGKTKIHHFRMLGLVRDTCTDSVPEFRAFRKAVEADEATLFLGHVRYSTVGSSDIVNSQPFVLQSSWGEITFAHNGQLVQHASHQSRLIQAGQIFTSTSDSEVLARLILTQPSVSLEVALSQVIRTISGAYSVLMLSKKGLLGGRDPYGIRPFFEGELANGDHGFSSEAVVFNNQPIREVPPGALIFLPLEGALKVQQVVPAQPAPCLFELLYFARPDQYAGDGVTAMYRYEFGAQLARNDSIEADLVCGVPDSGLDAAQGYATTSGIPFQPRALMRNLFAIKGGRSFILDDSNQRESAAEAKYSATSRYVKGMRVVVADDSMVRSVTARVVTERLRQAGAREVHWRFASPPVRHPCFYGIDMSSHAELAAHERTEAEISTLINADSVRYLPLGEIQQLTRSVSPDWCTGCFTGEYPIPLT